MLTSVICGLFFVTIFSNATADLSAINRDELIIDEVLSAEKVDLGNPITPRDDDWNYWSNSPHMYNIPSGNIGIGTTNPTNMLHIVGSTSEPLLNVEKTGSGRGVRISTTSACALWVENSGNHGLRVTNAVGDGVHVTNAGGFAGYFNGKGYFNGNVGIGITNPTEKLEVSGTVKATAFDGDIDWNDLQNIPVDFADGTDDTLTEPEVISMVDSAGYLKSENDPVFGISAAAGISSSDIDNWNDRNSLDAADGNPPDALFVDNDGDVGIGTTSPSEKLDVSGNVYVGGDISWETRTGYISISAGDFEPRYSSYDYLNTGLSLHNNDNNSDFYYTSPQLPHGATITNVTFYWNDTSSIRGGRCALTRHDFNWNQDSMVNIWSDGDSGAGSTYDNSISYATIDNSQYGYFLLWVLQDIDVIGHGVVIEYTYTEPY